MAFFLFDDLGDRLLGLGDFWIGCLHRANDRRHKFVQEWLMPPEQIALQESPPQQLPHDVTLLFTSRRNAFMDAECDGAHVVGNASDGSAVHARKVVLDSHRVGRGEAEGL